jgi:hypothetical protein
MDTIKSAVHSPVAIRILAFNARTEAGCKRQSGIMDWKEGKVGVQKDGQWIIHEPY